MQHRVVPLAGIEDGVAGIRAAVSIGRAWRREPAAPLLSVSRHPKSLEDRVLDEAESKAKLSEWGVGVPRGEIVTTAAEAAEAATRIGGPVVVKALGVAHKTDVGAVRLGIGEPSAVATAVTEMSNLAERFLVEEMVGGAVAELIVGVARDAQFGPYLLVGGGGILVELMKDSASIILPTTREAIVAALEGLKCTPLLRGFRGAPPADIDAVADAVLAVAEAVERDPDAILELDINPLMVRPEGQGAVAADALIRVRVDDENPGGSS